MRIETKFGIGDKVFVVSCFAKEENVTCAMCKGDKHITVNGIEAECPHCHGRGWELKTEVPKYQIQFINATVGQVMVTVRAKQAPECTYMLKETGVGSGTIWHEDALFHSEAEALAACEI